MTTRSDIAEAHDRLCPRIHRTPVPAVEYFGGGAGKLPAVLFHRDRFQRKRIGIILSGGNVDVRSMQFTEESDQIYRSLTE